MNCTLHEKGERKSNVPQILRGKRFVADSKFIA